MRNNGLWGNLSNLSRSEKKKRLKDRKWGNSEFQSILVDVVNSTDMKNKIETIVSGIKSVSVSYYEVLILALLVKIMSLNIETLQLLLRLGTFQLSDIFYNTVGGVFGGLMYYGIRKARKRL